MLFQSVINLTLTEPSIWRAGAATLYIRYLLHGYELTGHNERHLHPPNVPSPLWVRPLMGIINVLAGIGNQKSHYQDAAIPDEFRSSYSAISAVIWRDLSSLLPPGPGADYRRQLVMRHTINLLVAANFKRYVPLVSIMPRPC